MIPTGKMNAARDREFWASVRAVTESVVRSATPPAGFVGRELATAAGEAKAFAGVSASGAGTTVVVVVAPRRGKRSPSPAQLRRRFGLTERESEVALLLAARRSNKEIARNLSITRNTAWRHTANIMAKLSAANRLEASRKLLGAGSGVRA